MKKTPIWMAMGLVAALGSTSVMAQPPCGDGEGRGAHHGRRGHMKKRFAFMKEKLQEMKTELALSDAQAARIETAIERAKEKAKALRDGKRSPEKFEKMMMIRWGLEDEIHATLNAEQKESLRLLKREWKLEHVKKRFEHRNEKKERRQKRRHHSR